MMKEYQLNGIKSYDLKILPDERGFFAEILRQDWKEFLGDEWIAQTSLSKSFPGTIRAWHRHARAQVDYFLALQGAMKIVCYDDRCDSPTFGHLVEINVNEHKLQLVRIPGHYWHGNVVIGNTPLLMIYFVSKLYDYQNPDEERRPWNDSSIVPKVINGTRDDPRVGKPWRWDYPPHR